MRCNILPPCYPLLRCNKVASRTTARRHRLNQPHRESAAPEGQPLRRLLAGPQRYFRQRLASPGPAPEQEAVRGALSREFGSDLSVRGMRRSFDGATRLLNTRLPRFGRLMTGLPLGDHTTATVDLLIPAGAGPHPVLIYLHGGAWVAGSPASHRKLTARFAEAGYLVVSVDYRLAPEHPYPAAFEDGLDAVRWTAREIEDYGGDPSRLAIGGDSAGANLAAAVAIALKDSVTAPRISAALLIYGVFDMTDLGAPAVNRMIHGAYLPDDAAALLSHPTVSPIHQAAQLPASCILIGTEDALLPQSQRLRALLAERGVPHRYLEAAGLPHGFAQMEFIGGVRRLLRELTGFLDEHLAESDRTRRRRRRMRFWRLLGRECSAVLNRRLVRGRLLRDRP